MRMRKVCFFVVYILYYFAGLRFEPHKLTSARKSVFFRSCHHTCKENRKKNNFECIKCGYIEMADYVAAINIAARASVNEPRSSTFFYGSYKPRGFSTG